MVNFSYSYRCTYECTCYSPTQPLSPVPPGHAAALAVVTICGCAMSTSSRTTACVAPACIVTNKHYSLCRGKVDRSHSEGKKELKKDVLHHDSVSIWYRSLVHWKKRFDRTGWHQNYHTRSRAVPRPVTLRTSRHF